MLIFPFLFLLNCKISFKNKKLLSNQIQLVCNDPLFCEIEFDPKMKCENDELLKSCTLWDCLIPENGKIVKSNGYKVNLLLNLPSNTGYKTGAREIWSEIQNLSKSSVYDFFIEGIQQSVNIHIAFRYKKLWNIYLPNLKLFKRICRNEQSRRALRELKIFLLIALFQVKNEEYFELMNELKENSAIDKDTVDYLMWNEILCQIKNDLSSIDGLIGCIGCQKCKLWSKVQFGGLLAALKIFNGENLSHLEFSFLMNFVNKLIKSEENYNKMSRMMSNYVYHMCLLHLREVLTVTLLVIIFSLVMKR